MKFSEMNEAQLNLANTEKIIASLSKIKKLPFHKLKDKVDGLYNPDSDVLVKLLNKIA